MELFALIGIGVVLLLVAVIADETSVLTPTLAVIIALLAAWWFMDVDIYELLKRAIVWSPAYILAGVVWVFFKWFLFLKKDRTRQDESREHYLNYNPKTPENAPNLVAPRAKDNKDRIINWLVWWPFSVANTLLKDLFNAVYHALAGTLDRMSQSVFK